MTWTRSNGMTFFGANWLPAFDPGENRTSNEDQILAAVVLPKFVALLFKKNVEED
jgi:hypothetical protein